MSRLSTISTRRRFVAVPYVLLMLLALSAPAVAADNPGESGEEPPEHITLANFTKEQVGKVPDGWKMLTFDSDGGITPSEYRVVRMDDDYVLKCHTESGSSALFKEVEVDPQRYPYITWRWRIKRTFPRADGTTKEGDDYPARLYVAFKYDSSRVGYWTQMKFSMAKGESDYEGYPPLWALNYVWANKLRRNTWLPNPWEGRSKMIAVRRGSSGTGKWHREVRNYRQDFRAIVDEEPTPVKFIAVMIDGDNTNSRGTAYIGPIQLWSELPPRFADRVAPAPRRHGTSGRSRSGPVELTRDSRRTSAGRVRVSRSNGPEDRPRNVSPAGPMCIPVGRTEETHNRWDHAGGAATPPGVVLPRTGILSSDGEHHDSG